MQCSKSISLTTCNILGFSSVFAFVASFMRSLVIDNNKYDFTHIFPESINFYGKYNINKRGLKYGLFENRNIALE